MFWQNKSDFATYCRMTSTASHLSRDWHWNVDVNTQVTRLIRYIGLSDITGNWSDGQNWKCRWKEPQFSVLLIGYRSLPAISNSVFQSHFSVHCFQSPIVTIAFTKVQCQTPHFIDTCALINPSWNSYVSCTTTLNCSSCTCTAIP